MRACEICGADFESVNPLKKACSKPCSDALNRRASRERWAAVRAEDRTTLTPLPDTRARVDGEPWPAIAPTSYGETQADRQVWCRRYDECLDVAVRLQWPGFTCRDCSIRGTCDLTPDEIRALSVREASAAQMAIDAANPVPPFTDAERKRATPTPAGQAWRQYRRAQVAAARGRHGG